MHRRYLLPAVVILLSMQACGKQAQSVGNESDNIAPQEPVVQTAVSLLQSGTAARLEILYLPKEVRTRGSVDPQYLDRACYYRIRVEKLDRAILGAELAATLGTADIKLTASHADLRWGLIFYNAANARVLTIYLDKFGRSGLINGQTFISNGELDALLERRCSGLWARAPKP